MKDALGRIERVLVLGGGSAIGMAIAGALVTERGASHVILAARSASSLTANVGGLTQLGAKVDTVAFDLLDVASHETVVAAVEAFGDVDVVVLAGGILGDQARAEADPAHALEIIDTNFRGAASICLHVGKWLSRQGHGTLVVLSSIAGVQPRRANFIYGASKAGIDALARGLDDALREAGARVLVVRPGFVRSPMTEGMDEAPMTQDPSEVATAVLAGLDRPAAVAHSSGGVALASRIFQLLPRPLVRRLPR